MELERLDVLRTKSAITSEEFEAKKRELLGAASASKSETTAVPVSMNELAQQLRTLGTLYSTSAITQSEHQSKKAILLRQRVSPIDLKSDVETARTLFTVSRSSPSRNTNCSSAICWNSTLRNNVTMNRVLERWEFPTRSVGPHDAK